MALPTFYIDNVNVHKDDTRIVRGNRVADCYGVNVVGIEVTNCTTLRMKNNQAVRMRATVNQGGTSKGLVISECADVVAVYTVASRCDVGFEVNDSTSLDVYNLTSHNCQNHIQIDTANPFTFKNICLSNYEDHKTYTTAIGFVLAQAASVSSEVDYIAYWGLSNLYSPHTVATGTTTYTDKPLYMDEPNDDLTPDHVSIQVGTGTDNPLHTENPDIGGVESQVIDEAVADREYHYDLLDNTFWDVDNDQSAEVSFIKAFQSRILSNCAVALSTAKRDYYIKQMESAQGFAELFPAYARYANANIFSKRIADLWYATLCPSTLQSLQNAIGGYNRLPTFFQRLEDLSNAWVIGRSAVGYNNVLLGAEGLKYGIHLDVLGLSTLSVAASTECYTNVRNCIADVAPTKWTLHSEPQPSGYFTFADMYNGYDQCVLQNMGYNDDYAMSPEFIQQTATCTTGLIATTSAAVTGTNTAAPSGSVEISLLDRVYSERLQRTLYYRQGDTPAEVAAQSWTAVPTYIGGQIAIDNTYIQFRIQVSDILRTGDYEFVGLALRPYLTRRQWPDFEQGLNTS